MRPIGIFGGTFDPIHYGHLRTAFEVLQTLDLDEVRFIPCGDPPHRGVTFAPAALRLDMVRLATRDEPGFVLDDRELRRDGPSYSIDTAEQVQADHPGAELFWLIGDDQLPKLRTWVAYDRLRTIVSFAAMSRGPRSGKRLPAGVIRLPRRRRVDISASEIRERVKAGLPIDHLVPAVVAATIGRHGLYRS